MAGYIVKDLNFAYPNSEKKALDSVSFGVAPGEFVLVIGRSGSGKSTLLRHLKPLLAPHGERSGEVLLGGKSAFGLGPREQAERIGFVFQHPDDQIVTDKVWHELAFGLESIGCPKDRMRLRTAEMAGYFGLESVFYRGTDELSGGQKQLLNLASVMALSPDVLILDEPTSQLDPIAAFDFLSTVKKLNSEFGVTVILSEHRLEEAMQFADSVLVLEEGRVLFRGTPRGAAEELIGKGSPLASAMPAAARITLALGAGVPALTVNEGRQALLKMGLEPKTLPEQKAPSAGKKPVLSAKQLFFRYEKEGKDVLKDLSLELYPGEIYGLVGANGAGKSTLLSVLSGTKPPYRGRLAVNGKKLKPRFSAFAERISVLPQDPRVLFTKDSVREELLAAAKARGTEDRIGGVCALMETEALLDRAPFDLSGGEQQRAAIAKVLLTEPELLLLDEPTKGMDASMKEVFGRKLRALAGAGTSILLVSHDVEFCAEYADRAGFMFDGSVVTEDSVRGFFSENTFYTTAANRIARDVYKNALLAGEVTALAGEEKK